MKAIINFKLEVIDGDDAGFVVEEKDKLILLEDLPFDTSQDKIIPHEVAIKFILPSQLGI